VLFLTIEACDISNLDLVFVTLEQTDGVSCSELSLHEHREVETSQPALQEALTALNVIFAIGYPALDAVSGQEIVPVYRTHEADQGVVLLPLALSAFHLFTQAEKHRLHKCKNDRCILFFHDTTNSATRQWCSLECMNRTRSLQHYRQVKEECAFTSQV
jgi:predicted RNA-binding Zn ribbon-like protein